MAQAEFDELNVLESQQDVMVEGIGEVIDDPNRTKISSDIEDDLEELLFMAYALGSDYANRILGADIEADTQKIQDAVFKEIDGETWRERIRKHIADGNLGMVQNVIRTESDRVYNEAVINTAEDSGISDATKTWLTQEDEKVRHTHSYIDKVTVGLNEKFFTSDGDSALYPGGFSNVANNANCRCHIRITRK